MKYTISQVPLNAFIKVVVGSATRKVYFRDVKMYKKITSKSHPSIPHYHSRAHKLAEANTDEDNSEESCCSTPEQPAWRNPDQPQ